MPTAASSDAPCSAISVVYTEAGVVSDLMSYPRHPALVLVDTDIVARGPKRLLVAGMGDALATWVGEVGGRGPRDGTHPAPASLSSRRLPPSPNTQTSGTAPNLKTTPPAAQYEARTVAEARTDNFLGGKPTLAATALARLCRDILVEDGAEAAAAMDTHSVSIAGLCAH
jgi:glycerol dehydrogenase